MMEVRKSADRGRFDHGWLDTRHTFSFADYHNPRHMGFSDLRVINEDVVQPGMGFGTHGHRDMEIVTWGSGDPPVRTAMIGRATHTAAA